VLHTINPRLHPEQLAYICNHAEDQYLLFDFCFLPLVEAIAPHCKTVKASCCWARPTACRRRPRSQPAVLRGSAGRAITGLHLAAFDENAAAHCATSGTTGNPKGALYSHRSTVLHAYASALPNVLNVSSRDP
jgi:fatty-acyl-CoA synthase